MAYSIHQFFFIRDLTPFCILFPFCLTPFCSVGGGMWRFLSKHIMFAYNDNVKGGLFFLYASNLIGTNY